MSRAVVEEVEEAERPVVVAIKVGQSRGVEPRLRNEYK